MVHSVRALLAHRAARSDSIPCRLAFVFTAAPRGYHGVGFVRTASRSTVSARPSAGNEKA